MADYKRQHYLPAVYLKQFSVDEAEASRKSLVCRTDETRSLFVSVESQGAEDYHYSKLSPQATEEFFQQSENSYSEIAKLIWAGKELTEKDFFGLILIMLDLHIRNIAYENKTGEENYRAYLLRLGYVRAEVLTEKKGADISDEANVAHLRRFWRVKLLQVPAGGELITSDNPVIWCNWEECDQPHCIIMPVLPHYCAVAFDNRFSSVDFGLSESDAGQLNQWQVRHCVKCVYSRSKPTPEQVSVIQNQLTAQKAKHGYTDAKSWDMRRVSLGIGTPFSFIKKI